MPKQGLPGRSQVRQSLELTEKYQEPQQPPSVKEERDKEQINSAMTLSVAMGFDFVNSNLLVFSCVILKCQTYD